jgi:hypothetical protein
MDRKASYRPSKYQAGPRESGSGRRKDQRGKLASFVLRPCGLSARSSRVINRITGGPKYGSSAVAAAGRVRAKAARSALIYHESGTEPRCRRFGREGNKEVRPCFRLAGLALARDRRIATARRVRRKDT